MPLLEVNNSRDLDGLSDLGFNIARGIRRAIAPVPAVRKIISMTPGRPGKLIIPPSSPPPPMTLLQARADTSRFVMGGPARRFVRPAIVAQKPTPMAPVMKITHFGPSAGVVVARDRAVKAARAEAEKAESIRRAATEARRLEHERAAAERAEEAAARAEERAAVQVYDEPETPAVSYDMPVPPSEAMDVQAAAEDGGDSDEGMEGLSGAGTLIGKVLGGTVGFLVAGPVGAAVGVGAGHVAVDAPKVAAVKPVARQYASSEPVEDLDTYLQSVEEPEDEALAGLSEDMIPGVPNIALYAGAAAVVYWFFLRKK